MSFEVHTLGGNCRRRVRAGVDSCKIRRSDTRKNRTNPIRCTVAQWLASDRNSVRVRRKWAEERTRIRRRRETAPFDGGQASGRAGAPSVARVAGWLAGRLARERECETGRPASRPTGLIIWFAHDKPFPNAPHSLHDRAHCTARSSSRPQAGHSLTLPPSDRESGRESLLPLLRAAFSVSAATR